MSDEKIPSGRAARIACCSCVSARSIDSERPVRFLTSGPSTFHAYCRVCPDGRSPENALRAFIESSRMFMLNELRQRPLPGLRAHFDARPAIPAARRIVVPNADFLNLRSGRQPSTGEAVDADVGVLADELLQHLRELFGIVWQRGELFRGQLLRECAEQLRVFIGREHVDLLGQAGDLHHDIAAGLRASAHAKIFHVGGREPGKLDACRIVASRQSVEQHLATLVRDGRCARRRLKT